MGKIITSGMSNTFKRKGIYSTTKPAFGLRAVARPVEKPMVSLELSDKEFSPESSPLKGEVSTANYIPASESEDDSSEDEKFVMPVAAPVFATDMVSNKGERDQLKKQLQEAKATDFTFHRDELKVERMDAREIETRSKYEDIDMPELYSERDLVAKIHPYLSIVPLILEGHIESEYHGQASDIAYSSASSVMGRREFEATDFKVFTAGVYGMKRQSIVSLEILKKYKSLLNEKSSSRTLKYWGNDSYALYVLAPEILLRLLCDELDLPSDYNLHSTVCENEEEMYKKDTKKVAKMFAKGRKLFLQHYDYGRYVADAVSVYGVKRHKT